MLDTECAVEFEGIGDGEFRVLAASPEGTFGYGLQAITAGQTASFAVAPSGGPTVLRLPDGQSVDPMRLSAEEVDTAMGLEDLIAGTEIEVGEGTVARSDEELLQDIPEWVPGLLIFCLFVVGGIVGVGLTRVGLFRGRRKKAV